nr:MAG TPA: hypothetical protein [Bacteriophage sp.]
MLEHFIHILECLQTDLIRSQKLYVIIRDLISLYLKDIILRFRMFQLSRMILQIEYPIQIFM